MTDSATEFGPSEYLCYRLLVGLERSRSNAVSRSKFHKLSCLADRHLQSERDRDIGFPRYWYVYGEVMDEQSIDGRFYHAPAAKFWSGQRYVPVEDVNDWDFPVPDDEKADIDAAVDWAVRNFERTNAEGIKAYLYRHHIPNEFIRTYSDLREQLDRVNLDEQYTLGDFQVTPKSTRGFVLDSLERMVETYPRDDYPEAYELFVEWYDTVELLLEPPGPDYGAFAEFLDSLIAMLSKVELRFHHRQHIPDARIRVWENERLEAKSEFASKLAERRREILRERAGTTSEMADRDEPSATVSFSSRLDSFD